MEVSAGLASRVETQGPNEDEDGLAEPSDMAEFLNELGEGEPRCLPLYLLCSTFGPLHQQQSLTACLSMSLSVQQLLSIEQQAGMQLIVCLSVRLSSLFS